MCAHTDLHILRAMGTLYYIELANGTTVRLGDAWPDGGNAPDGSPIAEKFFVTAMFYESAQEATEDDDGNEIGEDLPAYFELWAQPKGLAEPPDDFPTFRMRLWLDAPQKKTIEVWKWSEMEKAIALRMGYDPDAPVEQETAPTPAAQPAPRSPALAASPPG